MRGQFWCKFQFRNRQNLWVVGAGARLEVQWVKTRRDSTVPYMASFAKRSANAFTDFTPSKQNALIFPIAVK